MAAALVGLFGISWFIASTSGTQDAERLSEAIALAAACQDEEAFARALVDLRRPSPSSELVLPSVEEPDQLWAAIVNGTLDRCDDPVVQSLRPADRPDESSDGII